MGGFIRVYDFSRRRKKNKCYAAIPGCRECEPNPKSQLQGKSIELWSLYMGAMGKRKIQRAMDGTSKWNIENGDDKLPTAQGKKTV